MEAYIVKKTDMIESTHELSEGLRSRLKNLTSSRDFHPTTLEEAYKSIDSKK